MKHNMAISILLVFIFLLTQFVGITVISKYMVFEDGVLKYISLPFNAERPDLDESTSFAFITLAILIATGLMLLIIRFGLTWLWKTWFFLAVVMCLLISFGAFIDQTYALLLSFVFAVVKIWRPNIYIHNLTELFIYAGLAGMLVPVINIISAGLLLLVMAIYDAYAVWKSGHMVTMAKFLSNTGTFAGLFIPYNAKSKKIEPVVNRKVTKNSKNSGRTAVLGGGDMALPLLFTGAVAKELLASGAAFPFLKSTIISFSAALSLFMLLYYSQKGKFYPAIPFLTVGCFLGYIIVILL
jgi:presenilin-like A22 family membrane protease